MGKPYGEAVPSDTFSTFQSICVMPSVVSAAKQVQQSRQYCSCNASLALQAAYKGAAK